MPDFDEVDKRQMGLYPKYDVIKRETGELVTEPVFVLNPQTDPLAMVVLDLYASLAFMDGFDPLAEDIHEWVYRVRHGDHPTVEGVEEWAESDFLTRLKLAKGRVALLNAAKSVRNVELLEQKARENKEEPQ
jgi:hypothetical protein